MENRTVTLSEDVYERLREERRPGESLADVVDRLLGPKRLSEFWDAWDNDTAEEARDAIAASRERPGVADRLEPVDIGETDTVQTTEADDWP